MKKLRALWLGLVLFDLARAETLTAQCLTFGPQAGDQLTQDFPPVGSGGGPVQTTWRVRFAADPKHGLYIRDAWFRRKPAEPFMQVIYDARISEVFVPYHENGARFYESNYGYLIPVVAADLGACGKQASAVAVKELRERGPIWKNYSEVRRGHELWLWGGWAAGNYNYIIRYELRDDGSIGFRIGATAKNLSSYPWRAHSHTALWRLDVDLDGAANDRVVYHRHLETIGSGLATDQHVAFNGGKEGWLDWNDAEYTMVNIADTVKKNALGRNVSYDLMLSREGLPRHLENFVHHDFAATNYRVGQLYYPNLPTYIQPGLSIDGKDVVLWYAAPAHHMPRTEDGITAGGAVDGVALLMWGGFDLKPRDLFDTTPLYP